jgi:hypothetical protein
MSRRANFILTDRQYAFLASESLRTGLSMSELVRRAIDTTYRPGLLPVVRGYELVLGLFRRPSTATIGRRPGPKVFDG